MESPYLDLPTVSARDIAYKDAIKTLGSTHAIFTKVDNKGMKKHEPRADKARTKDITNLADDLNLKNWRKDPKYAHLLPITDAKKDEIVASLRTLISSLGVQQTGL